MTTECGVCHEEYADSDERKPKLLPCSHTVCISCLNLLVDDEEQVQSPECRNVSDLPEDGPDAYKTNRYILEFMELVRKMKRVIQGLSTGNTAYTKRTMNKRRTKKVIRITSLVTLVQDNFSNGSRITETNYKGRRNSNACHRKRCYKYANYFALVFIWVMTAFLWGYIFISKKSIIPRFVKPHDT